MGVSLFKLKKWTNMLRGNSVYHVDQDEGKHYSKTEVKGFYNNFTDKVLLFGKDDDEVPTTVVDTGERYISLLPYSNMVWLHTISIWLLIRKTSQCTIR